MESYGHAMVRRCVRPSSWANRHMETASEELTDEFLLFAIESGVSKKWAAAFPDRARSLRLAWR